ncbi:MAG: response regulator [Treponema sp.]|jgi:YesN/AraC family two-component response regulator|nr:response regulator [Treponema sp.]
MIKILIADDEKNIRAGIGKILTEEFGTEEFGIGKSDAGESGEGIALFEAKNGEEALELAAREHPDILITDIRMPKMDGLELMRRIRLSLGNEKMNLIVLSGYDEFLYAQKAISFRAAAYILKPVDRKELTESVRSVMPARGTTGRSGELSAGAPLAKNSEGRYRLIEEAVVWIEAHLGEPITMAQAANQVSVNYSYFSEKFKAYTGFHFNEYLKRRRIALAMRLLAEGNYRIYETAQKCGYRDVKYFLRQFKEIAGVSPGKWRWKGC